MCLRYEAWSVAESEVVEMVGIEPTCNNIFTTVLQYIVYFLFKLIRYEINKTLSNRFSEFYEICRENSNFRILKILHLNKSIRNQFARCQSLKGEWAYARAKANTGAEKYGETTFATFLDKSALNLFYCLTSVIENSILRAIKGISSAKPIIPKISKFPLEILPYEALAK